MTTTPATAADAAPGLRTIALGRWRRGLTLALGLVWLRDAALQYQPYMFTKAFPEQVIEPVGQGSPGWVEHPDHWAGALMAHHIVFWNAVFATVQLAIAVGLLLRRTTRAALAASVLWAILVWWLGEGLGGVLAGAVSPAMGLPGAVIVYALIAVLLWPPSADATPAPGALSVAESGPVGVAGARAVWVLFWGAFVFETLRPADRSPRALGSMVSGMADGEPHWLATMDRWASHAVVGDGTQTSIVLAVVFAALALCVLVPVDRRPVLAIGVIVSALVWLIAEDLGQIATGNATDCNSGPLLALLATCYWPVASRRRSPDRTAVRDAPAARIAPA